MIDRLSSSRALQWSIDIIVREHQYNVDSRPHGVHLYIYTSILGRFHPKYVYIYMNVTRIENFPRRQWHLGGEVTLYHRTRDENYASWLLFWCREREKNNTHRGARTRTRTSRVLFLFLSHALFSTLTHFPPTLQIPRLHPSLSNATPRAPRYRLPPRAHDSLGRPARPAISCMRRCR